MSPFSKLLGNERAKGFLEQMLAQNQLANTLLFYGPKGVGKSLFALGLAHYLLGGESHPSHYPDLHILKPEGVSCLHPIESIRGFIEEVMKPPFVAPCKIFIIEDAHQMLPTSSNALLKTVEEPLLDTYIILLTDQIEMILPTIVSRCRKIPFFPVSHACIKTYLMARGESEDRAAECALLSSGSFAQAELVLTPSYQERRALVQELASCSLPSDYTYFAKLCLQVEKGAEQEETESKWEKMDHLFEDILWGSLRAHRVQDAALEGLFEQIEESRLAVRRHIKLRVVLEELFLR